MNNIKTKTFKDVYGDHSNEVYEGELYISSEGLTSLEGCYKEIKGDFYCSENKLTSFEYCPDVEGDFYCTFNPDLQIDTDESLEGLLKANIQGIITTDIDTSNLEEDKRIYNNVKNNMDKYKIIKEMINLS